MPDLLFEIGTEEIPAGFIVPALEGIAEGLRRRLNENLLGYDDVVQCGTPRRLVAFVKGIPVFQKERVVEILGPPESHAFDHDGRPTKAAIGFAKAQGVPIEKLEIADTPKGKYVCVRKVVERSTAYEVLKSILPGLIDSLVFPKSMRWESSGKTFARPIRWILALLDDRVVEFEYGGVKSGRITYGHPFLSRDPLLIESADFDRYVAGLRHKYVVVKIDERRDMIRRHVTELMAKYGGVFREEELLEEVVHLVEFPGVVEGRFDEKYLCLPREVLEEAMKEHQRYFPVVDGEGRIRPVFIMVTNRPREFGDVIRKGNERVLKARLEDAKFFYDEDRKVSLDELVEGLCDTVYLKGLGSYLDKARRLARMAPEIAKAIGYGKDVQEDAKRAAMLCKADLLTRMVGEFPGLQGVVGAEYAAAQGEAAAVCIAIREHYLPRGAGDEIPAGEVSIALALADKWDTIAGCFALGIEPSGSADPYALRRNGLGIIRIIIERGLRVSTSGITKLACGLLVPDEEDVVGGEKAKLLTFEGRAKILDRQLVVRGVEEFLRDRLYKYFLDRGAPHDLIRAVLRSGADDFTDVARRLEVLRELRREAIWPELVRLVERTWNIVKKVEASDHVEVSLLKEPLEKRIHELYETNAHVIRELTQREDYRNASLKYAQVFAAPVHEFFEKVFVNVEDERLRRNRQNLCFRINRLFSERIADLSEVLP